jgi:hypothetical protein
MTITKLLTVFDVYNDETEALDSFTGQAQAERAATFLCIADRPRAGCESMV